MRKFFTFFRIGYDLVKFYSFIFKVLSRSDDVFVCSVFSFGIELLVTLFVSNEDILDFMVISSFSVIVILENDDDLRFIDVILSFIKEIFDLY